MEISFSRCIDLYIIFFFIFIRNDFFSLPYSLLRCCFKGSLGFFFFVLFNDYIIV